MGKMTRRSMFGGLAGSPPETKADAVKNLDGLPLGGGVTDDAPAVGGGDPVDLVKTLYKMRKAAVDGAGEVQEAKIVARVKTDVAQKTGDEHIRRNAEKAQLIVDEDIEQTRKQVTYDTQSVENKLVDLAYERTSRRLDKANSGNIHPLLQEQYKNEVLGDHPEQVNALKARGGGAVKKEVAPGPVVEQAAETAAEPVSEDETAADVFKPRQDSPVNETPSSNNDWYDGQ